MLLLYRYLFERFPRTCQCLGERGCFLWYYYLEDASLIKHLKVQYSVSILVNKCTFCSGGQSISNPYRGFIVRFWKIFSETPGGAGYVGDWSSLFFKRTFLFLSPSFSSSPVLSFYTETSSEPKDGRQYATILAALVAPQSRGNVTLNSADTNILPTINTAYLQSPTDQ